MLSINQTNILRIFLVTFSKNHLLLHLGDFNYFKEFLLFSKTMFLQNLDYCSSSMFFVAKMKGDKSLLVYPPWLPLTQSALLPPSRTLPALSRPHAHPLPCSCMWDHVEARETTVSAQCVGVGVLLSTGLPGEGHAPAPLQGLLRFRVPPLPACHRAGRHHVCQTHNQGKSRFLWVPVVCVCSKPLNKQESQQQQWKSHQRLKQVSRWGNIAFGLGQIKSVLSPMLPPLRHAQGSGNGHGHASFLCDFYDKTCSRLPMCVPVLHGCSSASF